MSEHSGIEWTDATWNPTTGCTKVSPACAHCYIERTPPFRMKGRQFVNGHIPLELHHDRLDRPRHWRKPRRVFVNSLSDLFHEDVPFAFVDAVMVEIAHAVHCDFQVLTKRADRMRQYFTDPCLLDRIDRVGLIRNPTIGARGKIPPTLVRSWPFGNLWLGVSIENQHFADERIPLLLQTPAAVRFISAEPLLGAIDLRRWLATANVTCKKCGTSFWLHDANPCEHRHGGRWTLACPDCGDCRCQPGWSEMDARTVNMEPPTDWIERKVGRFDRVHPTIPVKSALDWVIDGGESGNFARRSDFDWFRSLRDQCQAAGVAYHHKKNGEFNEAGIRVGKKRAGRLLDGMEWNEFPVTR